MATAPRKTVYVCSTDHRDPIWNKCFENYYHTSSGEVVRSYADREDAQLDRWLELLPGTPYTSVQEITIDLKKYLERNPDQLKTIQQCVADGQLEFTAGGTTIIDYNVVHGESIYRNYLYSLQWIQKTFGVRPTIGDCFDTFGLSQQLPQILNQFGITWLPKYLRMFGHHSQGVERAEVEYLPRKPFWRGLDGSMVCIERGFPEFGGPPETVFVNIQYFHCSECHGEGCRFCDYTGMDIHCEFGAEAMEPYFKALVEGEANSIHLNAHTEETVKSREFFSDLLALGKQYDVDIRFVRWDEIEKACLAPFKEMLARGDVPEDLIDERGEPNPVGTGCYITRGILKRENRQLEHLLMAAEKFCSFATAFGHKYPREGFDWLWVHMNLVQAHDAITGNHPDGPFEEARKYQRIIKRGAGKRLLSACEAIGDNIDVPDYEGVAVTVFNPLNWEVNQAPTEVCVPATDLALAPDEEVVGWSVTSLDGQQQLIDSWKKVTMRKRIFYRLQLIVSGLPSVGYATYFCKPALTQTSTEKDADSGVTTDDAEAAGLQAKNINASTDGGHGLKKIDDNTIENERFRITTHPRGIEEIFDKELNKVIAGRGAGDLIAFDDIGSLWDRMHAFDIIKNLNEIAEVSVELFDGPYQKIVITGELAEPIVWDLPEKWSRDIWISGGKRMRLLEQDEVYCGINHFVWRQEITLNEGSGRVDFRTVIDSDTENIRVITHFPLGFKTQMGRAWYDIPYGSIERESYKPLDGTHLAPDGIWPTIHWAGVENKSDAYTVGFLNRGVPGQRFNDGAFEIHLLRSGRLLPWSSRPLEVNRFGNPLGKDIGEQVLEYALTVTPGDFLASRLPQGGYEFNAQFPAILTSKCGKGGLPTRHSFFSNESESVIASIIKTAEQSDDLIIRMHEAYGRAATDSLVGVTPIAETSPMEDYDTLIESALSFRPHEIKTVRARP